MNFFTAMANIFIPNPQYAAVPSLLFLLLWIKIRHPFILVTTISWGLYAIDEYLNKIKILCSGECNIRIDLLLIYPVLLIFSGIALIVTGLVLAKRL